MTHTDTCKLISSVIYFFKQKLASHSVYIIISLFSGYLLAHSASLSDLKPIMGTLQNLSASVFTLAGIWIAYTYPQAISAYTSPASVKIIPNDDAKRIENLVLIVLTSAFVISSLLIFNFLYLLISKTPIYAQFRDIFKMLGISMICYISFLQLRAIATVMTTNIQFVNELHNKKTERAAQDDL